MNFTKTPPTLNLETTWQYYFLCCHGYTLVFKIDTANDMVQMTLWGPAGRVDVFSVPERPTENYYPTIRYYPSLGRFVWESFIKQGFVPIRNLSEIQHPDAWNEAWDHLKTLMGDRYAPMTHPLARYITGR